MRIDTSQCNYGCYLLGCQGDERPEVIEWLLTQDPTAKPDGLTDLELNEKCAKYADDGVHIPHVKAKT